MPSFALPAQPRPRIILAAAAIPIAVAVYDRWRLQRQLAAARQAAAAARRDPLTGLPMRAELMDRGAAMAADHDDTAAIFLDCNGFKALNDAWGHEAGDEILIALGRRLHTWCSAHQGIAAHLGGDEFAAAVRLPDDPDTARLALAQLQQNLTRPVSYEQHDLPVSVSIGAARTADMPHRSWRLAMRAADAAMYHAKDHRSGPHIGTVNDALAESRNGRRAGRRGTHRSTDISQGSSPAFASSEAVRS